MDGSDQREFLSADMTTGSEPQPNKKRATVRSERIGSRLAGLFGRALVMSLMLNICLAGAVVFMATQPPRVFMVEESEGKYYRARGPVEDADVMRNLMMAFSKRYVKSRETVNLVDDFERWNWVKANSENIVWENFEKIMNSGGFYQASEKSQTTWEIEVSNTWQSKDGNDGFWSIEVIKQHYQKGVAAGDPEQWVVEMLLAIDPSEKTEAQQEDNPASLIVERYSSKRKTAVVKGNTE